MLSQAPNEGDVDDVVTRAFSEVLKDISDEVKRDPVAFVDDHEKSRSAINRIRAADLTR